MFNMYLKKYLARNLYKYVKVYGSGCMYVFGDASCSAYWQVTLQAVRFHSGKSLKLCPS